jgi:hypothetical protein
VRSPVATRAPPPRWVFLALWSLTDRETVARLTTHPGLVRLTIRSGDREGRVMGCVRGARPGRGLLISDEVEVVPNLCRDCGSFNIGTVPLGGQGAPRTTGLRGRVADPGQSSARESRVRAAASRCCRGNSNCAPQVTRCTPGRDLRCSRVTGSWAASSDPEGRELPSLRQAARSRRATTPFLCALVLFRCVRKRTAGVVLAS